MEGFGILILCLLGLVALVVGIAAIGDGIEQNQRNPSWRKSTPDPYYESEEYKKFCEERKRNYGRIVSETEDKNKTYKGKRGGRYTKDKTKDGRPYRRYF